MTSKKEIVLLAMIFAVLIAIVWTMPPSEAAAHTPQVVGRFQAITPNTALDTTTGELCWSYDPIGGNGKIRACKDIR